MSVAIAKFIGTRIFGEYFENKLGTEDPYFEQVPATRLDGTPTGKFKRVRKALPPGISDHDAQVLTKVKRRAYRLDSGLANCCGQRIGWDSVLGLIPIVGDIIGFILSLMVIHAAQQVEGGIPFFTRLKMYILATLDAAFGVIPIVGDVVDMFLKANNRNAARLESLLRERGQANLKKRGLPIPNVDPSDPDAFDRYQSDSQQEQVSRQPSRHKPMTSSGSRDSRRSHSRRAGTGDAAPSQPAPARTRSDRRAGGGGGGGGLGFGRNRTRPADPEMGIVSDAPARRSSRRA